MRKERSSSHLRVPHDSLAEGDRSSGGAQAGPTQTHNQPTPSDPPRGQVRRAGSSPNPADLLLQPGRRKAGLPTINWGVLSESPRSHAARPAAHALLPPPRSLGEAAFPHAARPRPRPAQRSGGAGRGAGSRARGRAAAGSRGPARPAPVLLQQGQQKPPVPGRKPPTSASEKT